MTQALARGEITVPTPVPVLARFRRFLRLPGFVSCMLAPMQIRITRLFITHFSRYTADWEALGCSLRSITVDRISGAGPARGLGLFSGSSRCGAVRHGESDHVT
jgi:hypothetical protein